MYGEQNAFGIFFEFWLPTIGWGDGAKTPEFDRLVSMA
jgi:hypothetical protein